MRFKYKLIMSVFSFLIMNHAFAVGTFIPAPNRVDMVHDFKRNLIYISNGGQVLRYDVSSGQLLSPFDVGGSLSGMDISPDGSTLAVADKIRSDTELWVHLIDLNTNAVSQLIFPRGFYEGGTFTVVYSGNGELLVTSQFEGSGWVPLRRHEFESNTTTQLASVRQNSMLTSSGDLMNIAIAESNSSAGPFSNYDVANQLLNSGPGTGWFNYEIGVNHNGTQFSVPTYGGTFVYGENFEPMGVIGVYAGPQPIGVVYHPAENIVYYAWRGSSEVRAYDTQTLTQTTAYDFEYNFVHNGNYAFVNGRLKTAADGSILLATVGGGVQFLQLYSPLTAQSSSVTTDENTAIAVALNAQVGNGGEVAYIVTDPPENGSLSGLAPDLVYTPNDNFSGPDSFAYQARYGKASVQAVVDISVKAVNNNPVAVDDVANLFRKKVIIDVLSNDYDVDGDSLSIVDFTQPSNGRVYLLSDGSIYYRAYRRRVDFDSFEYTVSDGNGGSATATVVVNYQ